MVADKLTIDCILGADCLRHHGAVIDYKECIVIMGGIKFSLFRPLVSAILQTDLPTVNTVRVL